MLGSMLKHRSLEVGCHAIEMMLRLNNNRGIEYAIHYITDRSKTLRWHICGLLHEYRDTRTVAPLIERLQMDPRSTDTKHSRLCAWSD